MIGHHATIRGGAGHYGLATVNGPELKAPLPLHLSHTHSVYVAVGILISAISVAIFVVLQFILHLNNYCNGITY